MSSDELHQQRCLDHMKNCFEDLYVKSMWEALRKAGHTVSSVDLREIMFNKNDGYDVYIFKKDGRIVKVDYNFDLIPPEKILGHLDDLYGNLVKVVERSSGEVIYQEGEKCISHQ